MAIPNEQLETTRTKQTFVKLKVELSVSTGPIAGRRLQTPQLSTLDMVCRARLICNNLKAWLEQAITCKATHRNNRNVRRSNRRRREVLRIADNNNEEMEGDEEYGG